MTPHKLVLIAEDDPVAHHIMVQIVESLNLTAVSASNGKVAWHILQDNFDIALLISDVVMDEMSGIELLTKLRKDTRLKHLPVLICSGIVAKSEISELLNNGPTDYASKPVNMSQVKNQIRQLLGIPGDQAS